MARRTRTRQDSPLRLPWVYAILDLPARGRTEDLLLRLDRLLAAGVTWVQVRAKHLPSGELLRLARAVVRRCRRAGALVIVNDRLDVALMARADGAHLGALDLPVRAARRIAPDVILGVTVRGPGGAQRARAGGATYVALGPMAPTATKRVPAPVRSVADLRRTVAAVPGMPVVAVGGVGARVAAAAGRAGAAAVAVAGALACPDPSRVLERLREARSPKPEARSLRPEA